MSSASQGLAPREDLESLLVKMGRGPQAGKSGDPRSQNADKISSHDSQPRVIRFIFFEMAPLNLTL